LIAQHETVLFDLPSFDARFSLRRLSCKPCTKKKGNDFDARVDKDTLSTTITVTTLADRQ
jgi:hypothetical protein